MNDFQKVYLLFCFDSGQYETYLCDIYTTREKAETERENRQKKPTKYSSRKYEVQEWEIQE